MSDKTQNVNAEEPKTSPKKLGFNNETPDVRQIPFEVSA